MTIFLPLEALSPFPQSPAFLVPSPDPSAHARKAVKAILKARRIAVVCGAGISVQAGIPDFRSSDGLFQSLKKDNPALSSGRDLFDASVFNSENTTSMFCQMIAQLSELSEVALPTAFHELLRALDNRGRLLRVYTQNIDALEQKCGLTFGVPELDDKRCRPRSSRGKPDEAGPSTVTDTPHSRLPTPPIETPRCIPLHGTVQLMHCQTCTHSFPLRDYLPDLSAGKPPYCPECTALEETRQLIGKRSRGVGKLRPSVVLYNEMHKDGEEVGDVVRRDLMGTSKGKGRAGADLLLVVGTSLRVPGTKRIVREFAKAVHSRSSPACSPQHESSTSTLGLSTPTPSPRRSPAVDEDPPIRTVYLNLDFPVPTREWEGVFDVWIRGDAQTFAQMVHAEMAEEERAKQAARERKQRREEAALAAKVEEQLQAEAGSGAKPSSAQKKRKNAPGSGAESCETPSGKKRKTMPRTPVSLPKRSSVKPRAQRKKPDSKELPTLARDEGKPKKSPLIITIPARKTRSRIEVSISTSAAKLGKKKPAAPTSSPSFSPLPSTSALLLQGHSSTPPTRSRRAAPAHKPVEPARSPGGSDRDERELLSDLSDEDEDYTDSCLPTLLADDEDPQTVKRVRHRGHRTFSA